MRILFSVLPFCNRDPTFEQVQIYDVKVLQIASVGNPKNSSSLVEGLFTTFLNSPIKSV